MRAVFYSCYPGFAGSQKMTLQLSGGFQASGGDAIVAAPDEMLVLEMARARGLKTRVIPAPPRLLEFGGSILEGGPLRKARTLFLELFPYNMRAAKHLRRMGADVVYAAQERSVLQIGVGARLAGIPLIWHAQGGLKRGSRRMHVAAARLATRIVCVSEAVRDDFLAGLGDGFARKLEVIHNGLPDIESSPPVPLAGGNAPTVIYLGNLVPEKGVHHLVRAFVGLGVELDARLVLAGACPDAGYARHLQELAAPAAGRVSFLGFRTDVPRLIAEADVVACPSVEEETLETPHGTWRTRWKEGFCLAALEGMRAGRPVVASASYGLREVVADGESGILVQPGDVDGLRVALHRLLSDADLARRLGARGRARFESQFREERHVSSFVRTLATVAGHGSTPLGLERQVA